jgi:hypothetical protein
LKNTKEKVQNLEVSLREVKARGHELKRTMKEVLTVSMPYLKS